LLSGMPNSNFIGNLISIYFVGFIIKLMDDIIDEDYPEYLYKALLPYILIFLLISTIVNYKNTVGLFMAGYIVGMYTDINDKLLSGLKGYQESILVSILGLSILGWSAFNFYLSVIMAIHLIDDLIDIESDRKFGYSNLAVKYGKMEVFLLSLIFLILSFMLNPLKSLLVLVMAPIVNISFNKMEGVIQNCK